MFIDEVACANCSKFLDKNSMETYEIDGEYVCESCEELLSYRAWRDETAENLVKEARLAGWGCRDYHSWPRSSVYLEFEWSPASESHTIEVRIADHAQNTAQRGCSDFSVEISGDANSADQVINYFRGVAAGSIEIDE